MKKLMVFLMMIFLTVPAFGEEIAGYLGASNYLLATGTVKGDVYANSRGRTYNPQTKELGFIAGYDANGRAIINIDPYTIEQILGTGYSLLCYTPDKGYAFVGVNGTTYNPATNEVGTYLGNDAMGQAVIQIAGELESVTVTSIYGTSIVPVGSDVSGGTTPSNGATSSNSAPTATQAPAPTAAPTTPMSAEEQQYKAQCRRLSYDDIIRNPSNYKNTYCTVSGTVDQVIEGILNSCTIYLKDSDGNKWECSHTYGQSESHVMEGDNLTIYGMCNGTTHSTTVLGKQVTLPQVDAKYLH